MILCVSLPSATLSSVPIYDFVKANVELAKMDTKQYYPCCGKSICGGCLHSFCKSGNMGKCPFCKAEVMKSGEEQLEELRKRVEANDAGAMCLLGCYYHKGGIGLLQDRTKAIELWTHSAKLGSSQAHWYLGNESHEGGELKMAKFHYEAAAMAGGRGYGWT